MRPEAAIHASYPTAGIDERAVAPCRSCHAMQGRLLNFHGKNQPHSCLKRRMPPEGCAGCFAR